MKSKTRAKRGAAPLTVLASALTLLACGGSDSSSSSDSSSGDFAAQANQACITRAKAFAVVDQSPDGLMLNQQQAIASGQAYLAAGQALVSDLQAIEPPSDVKPAFDKFVSLAQQLADAHQQLLTDYQANDTAAFGPDGREATSIKRDYKKAAASVGLEACASKLPADQVTELTNTIEANETSADPSQCTEYLTPNGVTAGFGSMAKCTKAQQNNSTVSSSVDVTNISGVDAVSASADVTFHGGINDGHTATYTFAWVDGKWKIDYIAPK